MASCAWAGVTAEPRHFGLDEHNDAAGPPLYSLGHAHSEGPFY